MPRKKSTTRTFIRFWVSALIKLGLSAKFGPYRALSARKISDEAFPAQKIFFPPEPEIRATNLNSRLRSGELYPSIGFRLLRNAKVTANRRCAAVVYGNQFLIPEATDDGPWNVVVGEPFTGGVVHQSGFKVLVNTSIAGSVEEGIFVGSWSPHNWFHWTIDTLPSVWLAARLPDEYDDFPILLPKKALDRPAWREPLSLVIGKRDVVELPNDNYLAVDRLLWIDSPTCPGPLPTEKTLARGNFRAHGSALNAFRADILNRLNIDESEFEPTRRVFLARRGGGNRPYNQEELIEVGNEFAFETHYLEDLTFESSVRLMLDTSILIGPHGAGWASALFCPKNITAIMWSWEGARNDNWFSNIAQIRNMNMKVLLDFQSRGRHLWLDKNILRANLLALFS